MPARLKRYFQRSCGNESQNSTSSRRCGYSTQETAARRTGLTERSLKPVSVPRSQVMTEHRARDVKRRFRAECQTATSRTLSAIRGSEARGPVSADPPSRLMRGADSTTVEQRETPASERTKGRSACRGYERHCIVIHASRPLSSPHRYCESASVSSTRYADFEGPHSPGSQE